MAIQLPPDAGALFRVPGPPFWSVSDAAERIQEMLPLIGQGGATFVSFLPEIPTDAPERGCGAGWQWPGPSWLGSS